MAMKYQPNRKARTPVDPEALEETPLAGLTSEKRLPSVLRSEKEAPRLTSAAAARIRAKLNKMPGRVS